LPTLGVRQSPQRAYGRPLTKKSKQLNKQQKKKGGTLNNNSNNNGNNNGNRGGGDGSALSAALSRSNLVALASMARPPPAVVLVSATVMILLSPGETVPEDLMWSSLRREIADTEVFLKRIATFKSSGTWWMVKRGLRGLLFWTHFMAVVVVTALHNIKPITDPVVFIVFILLPCFHSSSLFFPLLPSSSLFFPLLRCQRHSSF